MLRSCRICLCSGRGRPKDFNILCRRWHFESWNKNPFRLWRIGHYSSFSLSFGANWISVYRLPTHVSKLWCSTYWKTENWKLPFRLGHLWHGREAFYSLFTRYVCKCFRIFFYVFIFLVCKAKNFIDILGHSFVFKKSKNPSVILSTSAMNVFLHPWLFLIRSCRN